MTLETFPLRQPSRPGSDSRLAATVAGVALLVAGLCPKAMAQAESAEESKDGTSVSGSWTTRTTLTEGDGNDRWSSDLSLKASRGPFAAGFNARLDSSRISTGIHHEEGFGSFDLPERWVSYSRRGPKLGLDVRLGTSLGIRFSEGLVLGSASFEGLSAIVEAGERFTMMSLVGRTDAIDPLELLDEPLSLRPDDEEFLGTDGDLGGLRLVFQASQSLQLGANVVRAESRAKAGTDTTVLPDAADLGSFDVAFTRNWMDLSLEAAFRDGGGQALFLRSDFFLGERWSLGLERRHYNSFISPLGNAPLYSGLSGGGNEDENGVLASIDWNPTDRIHVGFSFDYTEDMDKEFGPEGSLTVKRDHRLDLDFALSDRTALSYGFEFENQSGRKEDTYDGAVHSLLVTHAFEGGGRLSGRLSVDRASTPSHVTTARLNYRVPFRDRKFTLLLDDTLRFEKGSATNALQLGGSARIAAASHLTLRGTLGSGEAKSLSLTWYQRF